jgi:hypothetical protein
MNVCIVNTSRWLQDTIHLSLSGMKKCVKIHMSNNLADYRRISTTYLLDLIFFFVKVIFFAHVIENATSLSRAISMLGIKVWQDNTLSVPPLSIC